MKCKAKDDYILKAKVRAFSSENDELWYERKRWRRKISLKWDDLEKDFIFLIETLSKSSPWGYSLTQLRLSKKVSAPTRPLSYDGRHLYREVCIEFSDFMTNLCFWRWRALSEAGSPHLPMGPSHFLLLPNSRTLNMSRSFSECLHSSIGILSLAYTFAFAEWENIMNFLEYSSTYLLNILPLFPLNNSSTHYSGLTRLIPT